MSELRVKGVTSMHLLASRCPRCGAMEVLGFWQDLKNAGAVHYDRPRYKAYVAIRCDGCGHAWWRKFRLTTRRYEDFRLCPWLMWSWDFLPWIPVRWWSAWATVVLWLEVRCPI